MNCYFSRNYRGLTGAGNKAKSDVERVMDDMGFKNAGLPASFHRSQVRAFFRTLASVTVALARVKRGDRLVVQYPLKKYFKIVCKTAHLKGCKVITLVHDLGSFRRKAITPEVEIGRLNCADYVIAANDKMKGWLLEHGCKAMLGTQKVWDYLSDSRPAVRTPVQKPFSVAYAGALNPRKNTFLYAIGGHLGSIKLRLYGSGFEIEKAHGRDRIEYMGYVPSDELIPTIRGDFGLVWDGESLDACTGDFGEYLQFNNPHKVALYIRSGLPVIIWDKAAMAEFVVSNGIGVAISSLHDLDRALDGISLSEYAEMERRVEAMSRRIGSGEFIRAAINEALEKLKETN